MKILFKTHNLGISMSYDHVLKLLPNGFSFHYLYCLIKIVLFFFFGKTCIYHCIQVLYILCI